MRNGAKSFVAKVFALSLMLAMADGVLAGTTTFNGGEITYTGTVAVGGDGTTSRILTFKSNGTLTLSGAGTADILVVGGGGGGGGGYYNKSGKTETKYYGNGGNGGQVAQSSNVAIAKNDEISITVGSAGAAGTGGNTGGDGGTGGASSVSKFSLSANGGTGGNGGITTKKTSASDTSAGTNTQPEAERTSSITGTSKVYGAGGAKASSGDTPAAGINPGDGGQGGRAGSNSGYAGGAGAAGVVIVKITSMYVKPSINLGTIQISVGDCFAVTNSAGVLVPFNDVTHWTSSNSDIATIANSNGYAVVKSGVRDGAAKLKMETAALDYNMNVRCLTVWIEKTIRPATDDDSNDKSNATIRVTSHVMVGVTEIPTNRILYIGSTCTNHRLGEGTTAAGAVSAHINTLATKGSVDWYLYGNTSSNPYGTDPVSKGYGHVPMGTSTDLSAVTFTGGTHRNLYAYLTRLDESLTEDHDTYDYVVLSFDGARLTSNFATAYPDLETSVARKLAWYYKNNRVIWIVDPLQTDSSKSSYDMWEQYRTEYYLPSNTDDDGQLGDIRWRAYVALVDPELYLATPSGTIPYRTTKSATVGSTSFTSYAAAKNTSQATYEDTEKVKKMLDTQVSAAVYDSELIDTVQSINSALGIKDVKFYTWQGAKAPETMTNGTYKVIADLPNDSTHWKAEPASAFKVDGYTVTANITNILRETWNKFEIQIVDKGTFLRSCIEAGLAKQDPETGLWEVDPNDGPAHVTLYSREGAKKVEVGARAQTTTILWTYKDPRESFTVNSDDATKVYDGIPTNIVIKVTKGPANPTIQYRKVGDTTWLTYNPAAGFVNVSDSSDVEFKVSKAGSGAPDYYGTNTVTITAAPTKPFKEDDPGKTPPPTDPDPSGPYHAWVGAQNIVKCYDGLGTNVVAKFGPAALEPTIRYSTNNVDFVAWDELQLTNACAATKIYFSFEKENHETITNYAYVTITQRVATITFAAADKVYDTTTAATCTSTNFENVVAGEGFALNTSGMSFAFATASVGSGKTVTATGYNDSRVMAIGDTLKSNYSFKFIDTTTASITKDAIKIGGKGPFDNENPPPAPPAKENTNENGSGVRNVVKTYDGLGTNIVVTVTYPTSGYDVTYSTDGGKTYGAAPSFTNVVDGTQVWYKVTASGCDTVTNYAWVTVKPKAVTVTADPKTKVYGEADPEWTAQVAGTLGADTVAYSLSRASGEDVAGSPYTITASGNALQGNYSVTYYPANLTITRKPVNDPSKPGDPAPGTGLDFGGEGKDKVPYKGTEWEPEVSVTNEIETLTVGTDFDVTYFDNIDSTNKAGIVITGKGNYSGVFTNYFEITKLVVTITADDKNIVYGSAVPPTSFYTFKGVGFTNDETIAILTVQPTFGSAYSTTTPVGPIAITKKTDAAARNYTFAYVNGTLTVTKDAIKIGGKGPFDNENPPPAPPEKDNTDENGSGVRNVVKTYDGLGTNIVVTVTYPTSGYDVTYSTDGGKTYGAAPSFTNVVDGTQVWYKVTASGCDTVTNYAWVTVRPKAVTLTSATDTFVYDGLAHSNVTVSSVGFVGKEGATYSNFATVTKVADSGIENNTFNYALKSNTQAENYDIIQVCGSLTVKPADIVPETPKNPSDPSDPTPSGSDPWTGAANIVKVFDNTGTNIIAKFANLMPPDLVPGVLYSTNTINWSAWEALQFTNVCSALRVYYRVTDANYNTLTNSAFVTITQAKQKGVSSNAYSNDYDSASHSIEVNPNGGTTEYLVNGVWTDEKPMYKDVVETNVIFRVTKPNYEDFIGTNKVTITKRMVSLTSASAKKVYDGAPLTTNEVKVTEGSFPGEEGVGTACVGSQTSVGMSPNAFDYTFDVGVKASNYDITAIYGELTVTQRSIGPDPDDPTKPSPGFAVPPIDPLTYDGQPQEPPVVVTNTVAAGGPKKLVPGKDYTFRYYNNTNATEEAYVVITGKGNYTGVYTNYFTILPREVTLKSGTKTMYLDPTKPGEAVVCSNGLVWVVLGSFVTNAVTELEDGFVATVPGSLESSEPIGPIDNDFTVEMYPGLATNYCFTLLSGELQILASPTNAQEEIHEEIPSPKGGIIDVVMDNNDAGKYAADKPKELNDEAMALEKGPTDKVEFRMILSTNYVETTFGEVTNAVVAKAKKDLKPAKEYENYKYQAFDIAVEKIHARCDAEGFVTRVDTNDWGNQISQLLTIRIPYAFGPKLIEFSVWRNHTNEIGGAAAHIEQLDYGFFGGDHESWETNATELVLHVKKFSLYLTKSLYLTTPMLSGSIKWKYHQAKDTFYAGLDVVCTNGDNSAISNLCYVFEDRKWAYLRELDSAAHLSDADFVIDPDTQARFAKVALPDVAEFLRTHETNTVVRYGVAESSFTNAELRTLNVVPTLEERRIAMVIKSDAANTNTIGRIIKGDAAIADKTLGFLTWQEAGYTNVYGCAVGRGASILTAALSAARSAPAPIMSLAAANRLVGYGLPSKTPDSDPSLVIEEFVLDDATVSGRVATVGVDGACGVPGSNARLAVFAAEEVAGIYEEVAQPTLDANGRFSFDAPTDKRFFKVRLTLVDVIY